MIPVICIGTVELTRGEFRVMSLIDALVAKVFANFEYLWNASNEKSFQEEFWSYSHKKAHFVIIVKRGERFLDKRVDTAMAPPQDGERIGVYTSR